eukprot:5100754-Alexandrium_andersonii.AAC.1
MRSRSHAPLAGENTRGMGGGQPWSSTVTLSSHGCRSRTPTTPCRIRSRMRGSGRWEWERSAFSTLFHRRRVK